MLRMSELSEQEELERGFNKIWMIWIAMLGTLGVYVILGGLFNDEIEISISPESLKLITMMFYFIGVVEIAGAYVLRRFMLSLQDKGVAPKSGQQSSVFNPSSTLAKYFPAVFISLAISESIAIFGLVLFFLGKSLPTFLIFTLISAIAMFIYRPKWDELEELALAMKHHHTQLQ